MPCFRFALLAALAAALPLVAEPASAQAPRAFHSVHRPHAGCLPDLVPPDASLAAEASAGRLRLDVTAADACALASVLVSLDGDVVAGRLLPPWTFDIADPGSSVQACALVTDRAGNSALSCTDLGPPAGCPCPPGEYCSRPAGECDGEAACAPRPEVCTADLVPVCGCDGVTYGNACEAARAGASIAHEGECD